MDYELMMNGNVKLGQTAPDFTAISTYGEIHLNDYKGKWLVLFSHPGAFTPVCTTEMIAFAKSYDYFQKLNTELLGLSIDSLPAQLAWMNDIYQKTCIQLSFPIIADRNGEIARKYGMVATDISNTQTVRNVFIIDDKGIVRTILVYPLNIGRFIPEILRIIQALQLSDCENISTPANWFPNQPVITSIPKTFPQLLERNNEIICNNNGMDWYLSFQNSNKKCLEKIDIDNCQI